MLRTLFLQNNDITRIDGLEGLVNLQVIVCGHVSVYAHVSVWVCASRNKRMGCYHHSDQLDALVNMQVCTHARAYFYEPACVFCDCEGGRAEQRHHAH